MEYISVTGLPTIMILTYLFVETIKVIFSNLKKIKKFLPIISAFIGGGFGMLIFAFYPNIFAVNTYLEAFITGVFCGLSATGSNQLLKKLKQLIAGNKTEDEEKQE